MHRMETKLTAELREKGYIPASEAASLMGVSIYTVYRRLEAKKLEGALVMGHRYVKESSIKAFRKASTDKDGEKLLKDTPFGG